LWYGETKYPRRCACWVKEGGGRREGLSVYEEEEERTAGRRSWFGKVSGKVGTWTRKKEGEENMRGRDAHESHESSSSFVFLLSAYSTSPINVPYWFYFSLPWPSSLPRPSFLFFSFFFFLIEKKLPLISFSTTDYNL
jgi:hypothetical protein